MITITAHKDRLLEKRSLLFFARTASLLSPPAHPMMTPQPDSPVNPTLSLSFFLSACVSISLARVTMAAPLCVRKLECHVLTGVRGMLTGQTETTDGSVTCPRSSGVPLLGSLDLKSNTLFACFLFSFFSLLSLSLPPFIFHSTTISRVFITSSFLSFSFHFRLSSACPVS